MNFQKLKKSTKWERLCRELIEDQDDADAYDPEVGADLRLSIIMLRRAIRSLTGASNSEG
jgi:hypothetical protein